MGMIPGLGMAPPAQGAYPGNLPVGQYPAPPGFNFTPGDPFTNEMIALQNQTAAQSAYLSQVYGPYLSGMLAQGGALAPTAATPALDQEMRGLKNASPKGGGKAGRQEAAAGMGVLNAETQAAAGQAQGIAQAGANYQSAMPGIANAMGDQAQNALYGPYSQNALAIQQAQAQSQQGAIQSVIGAISAANQAGSPLTSDQISSLAQLYGLSPDQTTQLTSITSGATGASNGSALVTKLDTALPGFSAHIGSLVTTSKGKTLTDVQNDVINQLIHDNTYTAITAAYRDDIRSMIAQIWSAIQQSQPPSTTSGGGGGGGLADTGRAGLLAGHQGAGAQTPGYYPAPNSATQAQWSALQGPLPR